MQLIISSGVIHTISFNLQQHVSQENVTRVHHSSLPCQIVVTATQVSKHDSGGQVLAERADQHRKLHGWASILPATAQPSPYNPPCGAAVSVLLSTSLGAETSESDKLGPPGDAKRRARSGYMTFSASRIPMTSTWGAASRAAARRCPAARCSRRGDPSVGGRTRLLAGTLRL